MVSLFVLEQFIAKYNGKFVEVGGSSNAINQCVDLANLYIKEIWNKPIILGTNAVDFPSRLDSDYTYVKNTPDGVPLPGDVVVFKKYGSLYGTPGHIAVVKEATVNSMTVFEQNYPTGKPCKIGKHNYLGCVGWFRLNTMPEKKYTEEEMTKVRLERDANWSRSEDYRNKHEDLVRWLVDQLKPSGVLPPLTDEAYAKKLVEELVKSESDLQRKLTQEEKKWALERNDLQAEKENLEKRTELLETKLQEAQAMIADLQNETSFLKEEIKGFNEKKKQLDSFQVFIDLVRSFFKKGKK